MTKQMKDLEYPNTIVEWFQNHDRGKAGGD